MKDSQARTDIDALREEYLAFCENTVDAINTERALRLDLERQVKHHEKVLNLLFTHLGLEVHTVPEVPAVAAIPAHLAIRKAAQVRDDNGRFTSK